MIRNPFQSEKVKQFLVFLWCADIDNVLFQELSQFDFIGVLQQFEKLLAVNAKQYCFVIFT